MDGAAQPHVGGHGSVGEDQAVQEALRVVVADGEGVESDLGNGAVKGGRFANSGVT
ncbi:hypothetical protein J7E87_30500 [Streptomyces sp. ISL-1]|uniref:hypothetical protein n=1 Tax=Streptomyces sp. ISL-1 TaxID=2817657 RepID=UPI001BE76635|nr:hypothetical protein [Streptomyces sp. ISL-1]MBT2393623.1 hypothetical protein [Streptomyces sp. ISL-1]